MILLQGKRAQGVADLLRMELDEIKGAFDVLKNANYQAMMVLSGDGNEKLKSAKARLILQHGADGRFSATPIGPDLQEQVKQLQAENERLKALAQTMREQCTKATERADQAEYMLRAGGLSDINHYMTQIKEMQSENERLKAENEKLQADNEDLNTVLSYQPEEGHKERHARLQALEIVSLRNRIKEIQSGRQVPQEWHEEPPEQRFDLP